MSAALAAFPPTMKASPLRTTALAAALLGATITAGRVAECHQPPPRFRRERPRFEVTSWVGLGGGAIVRGDESRGVFDLRLGGGFTGAVSRSEDVRLGPFLEAGTSSFASVQAVGGVELLVAAAPRPLRMFYYAGEGTFVVRAGAGWAWRAEGPGEASTPVGSVTVAWGYRCPFSLREPGDEWSEKPSERAAARYMVGVRLWVNTTVDLASAPAWQLTGGIEFEPVGTFRYLLGLY